MAFISLLTALSFAILGFNFPRFMGWFLLVVMPIGSSLTGLTIIPSSDLPFRITQAGFSIALGILMSKNNLTLVVSFLSHSHVAQFLLLFIGLSFCTALQNSDLVYWKYFLLYYVPSLITALIVGFLTIRNDQDFKCLIKIFVWSSAVIGALYVHELFTGYNLYNELYLATSPSINLDTLQIARYRSGGLLRPVGTEGDPISTGTKLGFLFPLTIWYFSKNKLIGWLPFMLTIIGILICQSRAVVISVLLGMLFVMTRSLFVTKWMLTILFIILLLFINISEFNYYISSFFFERFMGEAIDLLMNNHLPVGQFTSIPIAIDYFLESPIFGHGSALYASEVLMDFEDLPAPIMYLVSGGLLLCLSYISFILGTIISVLKIMSKSKGEIRLILVFLLFAFINGVLPVFFNILEKTNFVILLAYGAFFKVYIYNVKYVKGRAFSPINGTFGLINGKLLTKEF